ncbi:MAG: hypothetical protein ACTSVV_07310 [Promethearchaeota archaeon]
MSSKHDKTDKKGNELLVKEEYDSNSSIIHFEKQFFSKHSLNEGFESLLVLHLLMTHNKHLSPKEKQELCSRQREYMKTLLKKIYAKKKE